MACRSSFEHGCQDFLRITIIYCDIYSVSIIIPYRIKKTVTDTNLFRLTVPSIQDKSHAQETKQDYKFSYTVHFVVLFTQLIKINFISYLYRMNPPKHPVLKLNRISKVVLKL